MTTNIHPDMLIEFFTYELTPAILQTSRAWNQIGQETFAIRYRRSQDAQAQAVQALAVQSIASSSFTSLSSSQFFSLILREANRQFSPTERAESSQNYLIIGRIALQRFAHLPPAALPTSIHSSFSANAELIQALQDPANLIGEATRGNLPSILVMLEREAVNAEDRGHAIICAIHHRHPEIAQEILRHGSIPQDCAERAFLEATQNRDPFLAAEILRNAPSIISETGAVGQALEIAVANQDVPSILQLLQIETDAPYSLLTFYQFGRAFDFAAASGNALLVEACLSHSSSDEGAINSAIGVAHRNGHPEIAARIEIALNDWRRIHLIHLWDEACGATDEVVSSESSESLRATDPSPKGEGV